MQIPDFASWAADTLTGYRNLHQQRKNDPHEAVLDQANTSKDAIHEDI